MKTLRLLTAATIVICLIGLPRTHAAQKSEKQLQTGVLGDVACPSNEELAAMEKGQYILHARAGRITKVPAQKSRLPHDPKGHVQIVWTTQSPLDKNTVYVNQGSLMCKTVDGGKTWTSYKRAWPGGGTGPFQILGDGSFITVTGKEGGVGAAAWTSSDEGRTWRRLSQINMPTRPRRYLYFWTFGLSRLPSGTLLCEMLASNAKDGEHGKGFGGTTSRLLLYRSTDKGQTWQGPSTVADWSGEGGIARTASGKLLAALRYQRDKHTEAPYFDPDNIGELMRGGSPTTSKTMPFKHVYLADSDDEGRTWKNFRQLTTAYGQAYGFPAALDDGTVVVIHDTRYGPGVPSGRAMISLDEGKTWQNEAYYMYYAGSGGAVSGYSNSVVLTDGVILTIAGTTKTGWSYAACVGRSYLRAIRWKPVKN